MARGCANVRSLSAKKRIAIIPGDGVGKEVIPQAVSVIEAAGGMLDESKKIEAAVLEAVQQKKTTADIGGTLGTREAGEWVAKRVAR